MTPDKLAYFAGVLLSLLFNFVPMLNTWYGGQSKLVKQLIMLAAVIVAAAGVYGLSCAGLASFLQFDAVACDQEGLLFLITLIFQTAAANQVTYLLTPQTKGVVEAKAARG